MSPSSTVSSTSRRRSRRRWLALAIAMPFTSMGVAASLRADDCCPPVVLEQLCPPDPCGPSIMPMLESAPPSAVPSAPSMDQLLQQDTSSTPAAPEPSTESMDQLLQQSPTDASPGVEPEATEPQLNEIEPSSDIPDPGSALSQPVTDAQANNFNLSSGLASTAGTAGALALADTPNMLGDYLGGARTSRFQYNLAGDANPANSIGGSTLRNSKISDNNSAMVRDRASFRYHYFHNAAAQTSLRPNGQILGLILNTGAGTIPLFDQEIVEEFTESFDAHLFEFGIERRITENTSIELRLPFLATLDSNLALTAVELGEPVTLDGTAANDTLFGRSFAEATLGAYDFELRDLSIITKTVLYRERDFVMSGGMGTRVPIAQDSSLSVIDGVSGGNPDVFIDTNNNGVFDGTDTLAPFIDGFRARDIQTDLRTVSITPFLACAFNLTPKTFVNAFATVEVPLGKDEITMRQAFLDVAPYVGAPPVPGSGFSLVSANQLGIASLDPVTQYLQFESLPETQRIREQTLLTLDIAMGHWLYQARSRMSRLQRVAAIAELHYTTTLNDADIASFQSFDPFGNPINTYGNTIDGGTGLLEATPEEPFQVGNLSNRLDILNATFGLHSQWGQNTTVATGVGVPLRDGDDRLFDWEFQLQLNYYPGGFGGLPTMF